MALTSSVRRLNVPGPRLWSSAAAVTALGFCLAIATETSPVKPVSPEQSSERTLLTRGASLYTGLCRRCHGDDGDAVDYPGIVPLAGIDLRLPPGEIAGLSAPFVGRTFEGREAEALVSYLATLRGSKGFARPGYLFSPYLLHHKFRDRSHYRILDVRSREAYDEGHIPNAVHWPVTGRESHPAREPSAETQQKLPDSGVSEDTFVVIYDDSGGPDAAWVWWSLQSSGLQRTAILDGGLQAWKAAGYPVSEQGVRIEPAPVLTLSPPSDRLNTATDDPTPLYLGPEKSEGVGFDWQITLGEEGLLSAPNIEQLLEESGIHSPGTYRVEGNQYELGYLVFLLRLSGRQVAYNDETRALNLSERSE